MRDKNTLINKAVPATGGLWVVGTLLLFVGFFSGNVFKRPAPPVASKDDIRWERMVKNIQDRVTGFGGEAGIYIKDLKTGRTFQYNPDKTFICASLIKLPIMVATFEAIKEGRISLDTKIKLANRLRRRGSGELKWAMPGISFDLSFLLYEMITKSDNTATAMVIDRLGYDYLNQQFQKQGLKATTIEPTGMSLSEYVDPNRENYTTAYEMASILEKIYRHRAVDADSSEYMLGIMKHTKERARLARALPQDFQLARKTGLLRRSCHDVGIVFSPDGDFIVCVLTGQNPNYRLAKGLISGVGEETYAYLTPSS